MGILVTVGLHDFFYISILSKFAVCRLCPREHAGSESAAISLSEEVVVLEMA